jgi:hypothetical protein
MKMFINPTIAPQLDFLYYVSLRHDRQASVR